MTEPKTGGPLPLVPRAGDGGYTADDADRRRAWLAARTGVDAAVWHDDALSYERLRGNIENPVGWARMPLGVAGPLRLRGTHAVGDFYVPLATTEGALVRSYERGMVLTARAGGISTHVLRDENRVAPVFECDDLDAAVGFARGLEEDLPYLRATAEATTSHGRLLGVEPRVLGREVVVAFRYDTGDAHGMNMIVKATRAAAEWLLAHRAPRRYFIFSGAEGEKRASGALLAGGKGKEVVADVCLPAKLVRTYLRVTPRQMATLWGHTATGGIQTATLGYNGHAANGLTALFIACGQDVANVVNAAVCVTRFQVTDDGDLYASLSMPALTVATVGGGTALPSSRACLEMLDCFGKGKAPKFAEIAAATVLAGELSFGAAIASGEFVAAHETYGRNRPPEQDTP